MEDDDFFHFKSGLTMEEWKNGIDLNSEIQSIVEYVIVNHVMVKLITLN